MRALICIGTQESILQHGRPSKGIVPKHVLNIIILSVTYNDDGKKTMGR